MDAQNLPFQSERAPGSHLSSFRDRFALAALDGAGVLLDLLTGGVYELNAGATQICAALADGQSVAGIEEGLARSFSLSPEAAARDTTAMLAQLDALAADTQVIKRPSLLSFEADAGGFTMRYREAALFHMEPHGRTLICEPDLARLEIEPSLLLKWVAPHLLALQHQPILHASSVQHGESVLAFSGYTGAGKSTLARTFAAQGVRLISTDLLVIGADRGLPVVHLDGEARLHRWASENSFRLAGSGQVEIDATGLCDTVRGATLPLHEVWIIDNTRRSGAMIATEPMAPAKALVCLLGHGFAELPHRDVWVELLETGRVIAGASHVRCATVPDGLEALEAAVRHYSTMTAS